jgi:hypothetical protein
VASLNPRSATAFNNFSCNPSSSNVAIVKFAQR